MVEAIDAGDAAEHCEELGDLLFQIVFQAELRAREGKFGIDDVVRAHRRPSWCAATRTCSATSRSRTPTEVLANWGKLKAAEHKEKGKRAARSTASRRRCRRSLRAQRIGEKAAPSASTGPTSRACAKRSTRSCASSTRRASGGDRAQIEHELGDLLLAVTRLSAKLGVAPEDALRSALRRFQSRFEAMEDRVIARGDRWVTLRSKSSIASGTRSKRSRPSVPKK